MDSTVKDYELLQLDLQKHMEVNINKIKELTQINNDFSLQNDKLKSSLETAKKSNATLLAENKKRRKFRPTLLFKQYHAIH